MKKLLIALVVLVVLGLLCAGVVGIGGGAAWFVSRQNTQAQLETARGLELELMAAAEAEAAAMEAAAQQAELEAQQAAAEAALDEELAAAEELAEQQAAASAQAASAPRQPQVRKAPPPLEDPYLEVAQEEHFDEAEELNLDNLDETLGDDDFLGNIEILDDEPETKGRRKKKNR